MAQEIIRNGSHAVGISYNGTDAAVYRATCYVNVPAIDNLPIALSMADATLVSRKFTTLTGARKWAQKQLDR